MTVRTIQIFATIWGLLALLTAIASLQSDVSLSGHGSDFENFANRANNPEEIQVENPTIGTSQAPIAATISYPNTPWEIMTFIGRSATLNSPIFESWVNTVVWFFRIGSIGLVLMAVWEAGRAITNFIGNIAGRATP